MFKSIRLRPLLGDPQEIWMHFFVYVFWSFLIAPYTLSVSESYHKSLSHIINLSLYTLQKSFSNKVG